MVEEVMEDVCFDEEFFFIEFEIEKEIMRLLEERNDCFGKIFWNFL